MNRTGFCLAVAVPTILVCALSGQGWRKYIAEPPVALRVVDFGQVVGFFFCTGHSA
jgi:hypothetical protein